jgi:hypothetical protein
MKAKNKSSLLAGSIIILLIIISPYLLYLYQNIPDDSSEWNTIFGTIKGGIYPQVQLLIYFFFSKFVPLFLLIIWFVTNKHWWVHALIIPISVYLFQLISIINESVEYYDEIEFIYTVPIAVIVMVILYFIRSKMALYIQAVDLKREMDENMKIQKKVE